MGLRIHEVLYGARIQAGAYLRDGGPSESRTFITIFGQLYSLYNNNFTIISPMVTKKKASNII